MLEAKKNRLFENVFALYNRNLLRRRFHALRVENLEFLKHRKEPVPLLICANHSSWWDGLVAFQISRSARLDAFVLMEEKQLSKLFPFRLLGAFSVVRGNPREAVKSIEYAGRLLRHRTDRALWIFPQGEILPNDTRPLRFYRGLARIAEKVGTCAVASLSMRYEFLGDFKPEIFVRIERPEILTADSRIDARTLTARLAERMSSSLERLKSDIIKRQTDGYRNLI